MIKNKFTMGDLLKDNVSGFEGVVMAFTFYSTGCIHYGLAPQKLSKEGTLNEGEWLDQSRLTLARPDVVSFDIPAGTTSGPHPNAPQM